jgi:TPR repeat protein
LTNYLKIAQNYIDNKEYDKAIENLEKAIDNKEYAAISTLAMFYITGLGVEVNIDKGLEYLFLGEKYNDAKSLSMLGDFYYNGKYVDKNIDKAKELYERACDLNEGHAIGMLGLFYYNEENYSEAVTYFKSGVTFYDQNSMYYLGLCAYNGVGMDKDYTLSFMLFDRLYQYGSRNNELIKYLADSYYNGYGVDINYDKAIELYSNLNDEESIFNLGLIYKNIKEDYEKALECFKRVKNVKSQFEQALMLYNGLGCIENKNDAYFKFYACASLNYPYSYPFIGDSYYYGYGVKKDYNEAINWYKKALDENIPNQNLNIGLSYFKLKKYDEALNYVLKEDDSINKYKTLASIYLKLKDYPNMIDSYTKASDENDIYSTYELYKIYKKGIGVKKDKQIANNYYLKYITLSTLNNSEN